MTPGGTVGEEPRIDRNGRADHALSVVPECMPHDRYRARIRGERTSKWNRLPKHRPLTRADLRRRGVTRAALAKHYLRVEHGIYVPLAAVDMDIAEGDTETPGEDLIRAVHPAVLVMAHALRHPQQVARSFAAGALLGMRYFASEEPLEFLTPRGVRQDNQPGHIVSTQTRRISAYRRSAVTRGTSDPVLRQVRMTPLGDTLAFMLRTLQTPDEARDRRWRVPDLAGVRGHLTPEFIRCVQTSDAFHQALGKETPGNLTALRVPGTVSVDAAAAVLEATDVGAESPPETLLRLAVADLAPGLQSQIPVWRSDGSLLTVVDLGWEEHRVFLFYDGQHHLQRNQRDHDSEVLAALQHGGGRVLRVTAGDLLSLDSVQVLRERVRVALE